MGCNFNLTDSIQLCSEASSDRAATICQLQKPDTLPLFLVSHGGGDYRGIKGTVPVLALVTGCCSGVLSEALSAEAGTALKGQVDCKEETFYEELQFITAGSCNSSWRNPRQELAL